MLSRRIATALFATLAASGCTRAGTVSTTVPSTATAEHAEVQWSQWSRATFERAKSDNRIILINVVAQWCHWCHVMEEETYANPEVAAILAADFVAIRVDSDARPDVAERYREWGWPATGVLSPDAQPIVELRGFQSPDEFAALLRSLVADRDAGKLARRPERTAAPVAADAGLTQVRHFAVARLDGFYEPKTGGWGRVQKYPFPAPVEHALFRGVVRGEDWSRRITQTLGGEERLIDPEWGGMYQYSLRRDWVSPHYEKITSIQAGAIANFAMAARATGDDRWLRGARAVADYMTSMMRDERGGFFTSQDADLRPAHAPAVVGLEYYAKPDAERRALGLPRIDDHVYADNNGLMIGALAELYRATGDAQVLEDARAAAAHVMAEHATDAGGLKHGADDPDTPLYLDDQVTMARGLLALYQVTGRRAYRDQARALTDFVLAAMQDRQRGGFFAHTADPDAVGVFASRRRPLEGNGMAVRLLLDLHRYFDGDGTETRYRTAAERALRALGGEATIKDNGRIIGEFVLALESATMRTVDVTVVGTPDDKATQRLLAAALAHFEPRAVIEVSPPGERYPSLGSAAIFLCTSTACSSPIKDPASFEASATRFIDHVLDSR